MFICFDPDHRAMWKVAQKISFRIFVVFIGAMSTGSSYAFDKLPITPIEWNMLSRLCKVSWDQQRAGNILPWEKKLTWKTGGWHYCNGYVRVLRAELTTDTRLRNHHANKAVGDVDYSYRRIDKKEPWAAEMAVTKARALILINETEEAKKVLDEILPLHPGYKDIYIAYASILFKEPDFEKAVILLEDGVRETKGRYGDIHYYLGMAYINTGNVEAAREQMVQAKKLGYPLKALERKIQKHDRRKGEAG